MSTEDLTLWVFVLALVFLFSGTPDVWDRLHAAAMGVGCAP
jgi:hypothetical protein